MGESDVGRSSPGRLPRMLWRQQEWPGSFRCDALDDQADQVIRRATGASRGFRQGMACCDQFALGSGGGLEHQAVIAAAQ